MPTEPTNVLQIVEGLSPEKFKEFKRRALEALIQVRAEIDKKADSKEVANCPKTSQPKN